MTMTILLATPPPSPDISYPVGSPLTRFIGRADEVAALFRQMDDSRLLSLIGPGGSGKTRLAQAVRDRWAAVDRSGGNGARETWWVPLAEVDGPALLAPAVAEALGVAEVPGRPLIASLAAYLRERGGLLVFDNCEHLVEACAALAGRLLPACPGLRLLTTSREPLAVAGEVTWWVNGLSPPADLSAPAAADIAGSEAVQLFVDRARLVQPGFALTDGNARAVARLCLRLDGMPLALELAAARLRVLPLERIVDRLDDVFSLLVSANRDAVPRHATLRATLAWSHDLLPPREREVFARLSVFRGGFTLDAAEAVTAEVGGGLHALDLIARLVDKSLVQACNDGQEERYRLLEVVRQYADEQLGERRGGVATRHAAYFLALAEQAEQVLDGASQQLWLDRLYQDQDNVRAALGWSQRHDTQLVVRLAAALGRYYRMRGHYGEGRHWLHAAVAVADGRTPPTTVAKALTALGTLEFLQCEYDQATSRLRRALELYTGVDDLRGVATTLQSLGSIAREQGRYADARSHHEDALLLWRRLDEPTGVARAVKALGFTAWLEGDHARAVELAGDALSRFRELDDSAGVAAALVDLAAATYRLGNPRAAQHLLRESLTAADRLGLRETTAWATEQLGLIAATLGDRSRAATLLAESLTVHHELGDRWRTASTLDALAGQLTDASTGARLLAAADQLRQVIGTPLAPCENDDHDRRARAVHSVLGADELRRASAEGRAMSADQVVAMAVTAADGSGSSGERPAARPTPSPVVRDVPVELRVHALGRARVELAGRPLGPEDWTYAKPRELLFHLLSRPGSTKAEIGLDLWPDASDSELRNSFHTCLKHLRRALGGTQWVRFDCGGYRIDDSATLWYDVDVFCRTADEARQQGAVPEAIPALAAASEHYPGDFLVDAAVGDWARPLREQLRRRYEQVMLAHGGLLARQRRFAEAADTFARLVEYDPLLEAAHRGLMRCHAALGNRGRALRQYDDLVRVLDVQVGAPPAPETTTLHTQLRRIPPGATAVA